MDDREGRRFKVSWVPDGKEYLDEGVCHHCGRSVQFRTPAPGSIRVESRLELGDGAHREEFEDFLVGICTRQDCGRTTVVRSVSFTQFQHGDYVDHELGAQEIIYPRRTSNRTPLSTEVPEALRTTFDEAAAIEYQSATACGFLAGRLLEQALRHRLLKDADSSAQRKKELRGTTMAGLIKKFIEAGHASGDVQELMELLQGFRNFAAHPPQPEDADELDIDGPQASFLLNAARELLEHIYVRPARLAEMRKQLEQKKRGDAILHAAEFELSDRQRTTGPTRGPLHPGDEDVPF